MQRPAAQVAAALAKLQRLPQTPQFMASVEVAVSQPLVAMLSQLPKPSRQLARVHALALHPATAPGRVHWLPQVRQLLGSLVRSRQVLPQSTWPGGHWIWQNATLEPPSGPGPASLTPPSTPLAAVRVQRSPEVVAQALPQAPQFWSVVSDTHWPLQIAWVGPEQSTQVLARHATPAPLQVPARPASMEVPPSPAAAPAQQGWPGAPQATQVPAEQVVPALRQIVRAPLGAVAT